jgi:hypothetical protein
MHCQTAKGFGPCFEPKAVGEPNETLFCKEVSTWVGLLVLPIVVGLTDGVMTSIPNPKNTDCRPIRILALIFT